MKKIKQVKKPAQKEKREPMKTENEPQNRRTSEEGQRNSSEEEEKDLLMLIRLGLQEWFWQDYAPSDKP